MVIMGRRYDALRLHPGHDGQGTVSLEIGGRRERRSPMPRTGILYAVGRYPGARANIFLSDVLDRDVGHSRRRANQCFFYGYTNYFHTITARIRPTFAGGAGDGR